MPVFTDDELTAMQDVLDPRLAETPVRWFLALRDRAVLMLFIDTPARKAEMAGLRLEDVDLDEQRVKVFGKGGKERYMPIGPGTVALVHEYLMARAGLHPVTQDLWVDCTGLAMGEDWVPQMMSRLALRAGVPNMRVHRFRHTFAYRMLKAGVPPRIVELLGGWSRIPATYLSAFGEIDVREAHRGVSPAEDVSQEGGTGPAFPGPTLGSLAAEAGACSAPLPLSTTIEYGLPPGQAGCGIRCLAPPLTPGGAFPFLVFVGWGPGLPTGSLVLGARVPFVGVCSASRCAGVGRLSVLFVLFVFLILLGVAELAQRGQSLLDA